jgi:hypothetical protein
VYTPGFFVDGKEWRGYFSRSRLPENKLESAGTLKVQRSDNKVAVNYSHDGAYIAHIALLAMDETTEIKAGENRGRTLDHDFVVLEKQQMRANSEWQFQLKNWSDRADAIAVWLTKPDSFTPIQTVAGFLSKP